MQDRQSAFHNFNGAHGNLVKSEIGRVNVHGIIGCNQRRVGTCAITLIASAKFSEHAGFFLSRVRILLKAPRTSHGPTGDTLPPHPEDMSGVSRMWDRGAC